MASSATRLNTTPSARRVAIINKKVTGPPAKVILWRSAKAHQGDIEVLDNASGAGILIDELLELADQNPDTVSVKRAIAGDIDENMLAFARAKQEDAVKAGEASGWKNVEVKKIDQQSLTSPSRAIALEDASFTHIFSNFGIFFCQDNDKALAEAHRVLRLEGVVGFTSWKAITWWHEIVRPAMARYIPDALALPPPVFPSRDWDDPYAITAKLEKAGFSDVDVGQYSFTPDVGPEDFAEAMGVLVNILAKRVWSEGDSVKFSQEIEPALLRFLRENYDDSRWDGKMTAFVSLARKL